MAPRPAPVPGRDGFPMPTSRLPLRLAAAALGIAVAIFPGSAEEPALRNEDVVRMLVGGNSPAEVAESIRRSRTAFDLSDDMVVELRLAGVPESVLDAMRASRAALEAAAPPEPSAEIPAAAPIRVAVAGFGGDAPPRLAIPRGLDDDDARGLGLDPADPERTVARAAVFLACRTADHVPDQWRSRSPLGRDFVSVSRHRMLDFRAVDLPEARAGREDSAAAIELPAALTASVEPGIAHDLVVGIAVEVGGRFLQVASARLDDARPSLEGLGLRAEIRPGERWPTIELSSGPRKTP